MVLMVPLVLMALPVLMAVLVLMATLALHAPVSPLWGGGGGITSSTTTSIIVADRYRTSQITFTGTQERKNSFQCMMATLDGYYMPQ